MPLLIITNVHVAAGLSVLSQKIVSGYNMRWPVPDAPGRKILPEPVYRRWIMLLVSVLTVDTLFILLVWNSATYRDIFIYGVLPVLFLQSCLFGTALNKYE